MSGKYHEAQSGKNQGQMVKCYAKKRPCRFGESNHEVFESTKDAEKFNELLVTSMVQELSPRQIQEYEDLKEKSFRLKEKMPVKVFNNTGVDEMGNVWKVEEGQDGFYWVKGVNSLNRHLTQGMVPASSPEEAVNEMVDRERYRRRNSPQYDSYRELFSDTLPEIPLPEGTSVWKPRLVGKRTAESIAKKEMTSQTVIIVSSDEKSYEQVAESSGRLVAKIPGSTYDEPMFRGKMRHQYLFEVTPDESSSYKEALENSRYFIDGPTQSYY